MNLEQFVEDVYAPLKGIDDRTVALYKFTIKPFSAFLGRQALLTDLEELQVARFLQKRVRERAPATAAKDRAQLRAIWEFAARRKLVDTWPSMPRITVPERVPEAWVTEEMSRMLESAAKETANYDGIPASLWWRALLLVAYDTGERATAVVSLRWADVRGSAVVFRAEDRKGKRRDILREIGPETVAALEAIRGDRELVFPFPRAKTYLWDRLGIILKRAGLPHGRRDKFHKIRRTTASYYEAAGGSAQRLLDHSSPAVTRRYLDPRIVKGLAAPDVIPRLSPPKAS